MDSSFICVICKKHIRGEFGNNAVPLAVGICCNECNEFVIIARIAQQKKHEDKQNEDEKKLN